MILHAEPEQEGQCRAERDGMELPLRIRSLPGLTLKNNDSHKLNQEVVGFTNISYCYHEWSWEEE
jgi:hypothetical protein